MVWMRGPTLAVLGVGRAADRNEPHHTPGLTNFRLRDA